jgi:hypothetical protein
MKATALFKLLLHVLGSRPLPRIPKASPHILKVHCQKASCQSLIWTIRRLLLRLRPRTHLRTDHLAMYPRATTSIVMYSHSASVTGVYTALTTSG